MKAIKIERLDNNYRIKILFNKIDSNVKINSVIFLDEKPVKVLSIKEINLPLTQYEVVAKEFNPSIYVWTTNILRKSNIYKVGIVKWQSIYERMKQTYTTGVCEPIQVVDTWNLDTYNTNIVEKIESEIHNTIGLYTPGREFVQADYKKVVKPTIEEVIKKWTSVKELDCLAIPPRYFQKDASDLAHDHYKKYDKGWIQWTCGSGKSFGSYWIYESVMKAVGVTNNIIVLLVPSKQLVEQTSKDWINIAESYNKKIKSLKISSDECNDIENFLSTSTKDNINFITCTYQSSHKLSSILKMMNITVDFLINDEVHRLTGEEGKSWSQCLFDSHLSARKRLSMTASPIEYTSKSWGYFGMENESLFGKKFHTYSFLDAQFDGYISPIQVMGVEIINSELEHMMGILMSKKDIIQKNLYGSIDLSYLQEEVNISKGNPAFFMQLHNTLCCLRDGKFTHPLIYANSAPRIEMFMACLKSMAPVYGVDIDYSDIFTSKNSSVEKRIFDLENKFSKSKIGVVGNLYCLQEGISINKVDAVVMIDPRSSGPAIIQILGRPVRLDYNNPNKIATILLPIFIKSDNGKISIDNSHFDSCKEWIINLCAADSEMINIMTDMKFTTKSREGIEVRNVSLSTKKRSISGKNKTLDKKETTYESVDFYDIFHNSEIKLIIDTKMSVNNILLTDESFQKRLSNKATDFITDYKTKIEVALLKSKYHKNHTTLIKNEEDYISDFSQSQNIEFEKSKELLNRHGLKNIISLKEKLQDKITILSLI